MITPANACTNNLMDMGRLDRNWPVRNTVGATAQENKIIDIEADLISCFET